MKLTFSPLSPFARKVRICAIELGLIDRIELVPTTAAPTVFNEDYSRNVSPLRKLPALILDDGRTIVDSYVIAEYLDELGGRKLIPQGAKKWQVKTEHSITQGMLDAMLLCRYESARPEEVRWQTWIEHQWDRVWKGLEQFETRGDILNRPPLDVAQIGLVCILGYADLRFPDCGWRKAFPKIDAFHNRMLQRESVKVSVPPPA